MLIRGFSIGGSAWQDSEWISLVLEWGVAGFHAIIIKRAFFLE